MSIGSTDFKAQYTQPHPSQIRQKNARSKDEQLSLDALHDIATGADSPTERQTRRQEIEKYIKTQKNDFRPVNGESGIKVSGFNHIIKLPPRLRRWPRRE